RVEVTYTVEGSSIAVTVRPVDLQSGYSQVAILNEQSGAFDDFADASKTLVGPALGPWVQATGDWARLRSARLGVEWSLPAIHGAERGPAGDRPAPAIGDRHLLHDHDAGRSAVAGRAGARQSAHGGRRPVPIRRARDVCRELRPGRRRGRRGDDRVDHGAPRR